MTVQVKVKTYRYIWYGSGSSGIEEHQVVTGANGRFEFAPRKCSIINVNKISKENLIEIHLVNVKKLPPEFMPEMRSLVAYDLKRKIILGYDKQNPAVFRMVPAELQNKPRDRFEKVR